MSYRNIVRYQCRRGLLELDIIFSNFFDNFYEDLSHENKELFLEFLTLDDNDLWGMLNQPLENINKYNELIKLINNSKKNKK